jgi:WD40 repeat protein
MSEEVKRSLLNSKEIIHLLRESTPKIQKALQLSNMLDIFQDDYLHLGDEDFAVVEGSVVHLAEYQSFADLKRTKDRSVSCIEWHPSAKGVVALSCSRRVSLDDRIDVGFSYKHRQSFIIFWSFSDPIHPQLVLEAPDDICCFQFNKEDNNIVVAGCANGQLVLWDISEHQERLRSTKGKGAAGVGGGKAMETPTLRYLVLSSIELGHRSACTDIQWLPKHLELTHAGELMENGNNGGNQLVTTSLDGTVSFWDLRYKKELAALDLVWRPFYRMPLSAADGSFEYGLVKIALRRDVPERKVVAAVAKPGGCREMVVICWGVG